MFISLSISNKLLEPDCMDGKVKSIIAHGLQIDRKGEGCRLSSKDGSVGPGRNYRRYSNL